MDSFDKYLNMSDNDIDHLLMDINVDENDNIQIEDICICCGSNDLIFDENNKYNVCQECGVVNKDILDRNANYDKDDSSTSYGRPTSHFFPQASLSMNIKTKGFSKISMLQRQSQMPYKEKSLMDELTKIQRKCKEYSITQKIVDTAKILYKKISDCKHDKGTRKGKNRIMRCINRRSMIAACVYYACKVEGEPRSPKEIADIYSLDIKHVNRGYRKFMDYVNIQELFPEFKSSSAQQFINRFGKILNIEQDNIKKAIEISENIKKLDLAATHEPPSVAAGCLLLVININNLNINRKDISTVFKISDVTISKTYRRIYPFRKIICNNEITNLILEKKNKMTIEQKVYTENNLVIYKK